MSLHHAASGDPVDLATWGDRLPAPHSSAIAKTDGLEIAHLVLEPGKDMHPGGPCHVPGPIVVHCLDGELEVGLGDSSRRLRSGQLLYLDGGTPHTLRAVERSVALLTIVLV